MSPFSVQQYKSYCTSYCTPQWLIIRHSFSIIHSLEVCVQFLQCKNDTFSASSLGSVGRRM